MKISAIIAFIFSLPPLIVYGMSLISKSHFESVFLTDDQLLKKRFLSIGEFAFGLAYLLTFFYILWKLFISETIDMTSTVLIFLGIFLITWILSILYRRMITDLLIKNKTMLKVSIENLGEVYIIKMFDSTTCICSKDAQVDLNESNDPIYFVRIEDLIKSPITKEKIALPTRSIYQKLFN